MTLRDTKTLVFCQTKRRVDEIYRMTKQIGFPVVSCSESESPLGIISCVRTPYHFSFVFMVINNNHNEILLWVNFVVDERLF